MVYLVILNKEVGKKDKPLAIFFNKADSMAKIKEFVCIPKSFFYQLISNNSLNAPTE